MNLHSESNSNSKHGCLQIGCLAVIIFFIVLIKTDLFDTPSNNTTQDNFTTSESTTENTTSTENEQIIEKNNLEFISGIIYQNDDLIITLVSGNQKSLIFEIENIGSKNIVFSTNGMSINGIMVTGFSNTYNNEIPSSKKDKIEILVNNWFNKYDDIGYVDISFSYFYADNYDIFNTGAIRLESNYFKEEIEVETPENAIEANNVYVYKIHLDNDKVVYNIINKNDYIITTDIENCSLNDWVFTPSYSSVDNENIIAVSLDGYDICVFPNSIASVTINFTDFTSENNISEVENFEFSLSIIQNDNYYNNWDIENIVFTKD